MILLRSWISEKCVALTTTTISRSPPRCRPPLLKIGALRPQWPQMYPPNFQRLKLVPSTTRSRHPLPALYRVPGQLTEPSRRQSSCFLQCSPSPCTLPGHSLGHIRVHEPPSQQKVTPHRPPLLRNATSGDMWGEGTRYEFLPGPHVSPLRAGPPQEKKRLPGAEGPPEGNLACSGPLPCLQGPAVIKT